ncbi:inositol-trisphosphate 3-kinase A-like [Sycon ciliatum]|uniref:inositol-trisphosphate 3-kinase A-like n=1 Tax=Sycon ciliatum TaxID=27933 RepID=UPI0020AD2C88|eukprot:scpid42999/ scgid11667/ Inositol-trisphosphate 3-kinase B; Inositol 1,4,5-trisphosphate 3-kinase B
MSSPSPDDAQEKGNTEDNSASMDVSRNQRENRMVTRDNSRSNCVISILPADDDIPNTRTRGHDDRPVRRRLENLNLGNNLGSSHRPRARSMVGRLPSDSTRSETETANVRRSKTIELANEWASDSELDSMDSDSLSSGTRLTPSPLLPMDDLDRERSISLSEPLTDAGREPAVHYAIENTDGPVDSTASSSDTVVATARRSSDAGSDGAAIPSSACSPMALHAGSNSHLVLSPVTAQQRSTNTQFLHVPVSTVGDSSDSEARAVSDDASDRSAKGSASDLSPSTSRKDQGAQRIPKMGKRKWSVIRKAVMTWSPFVQIYRRKYPWVQLAGHQGNFRAGDNGTILKKACDRERNALSSLMKDVLKPFVPTYTRQIEQEGEEYLEMQDLLAEFEHPAVMDIKMGVRTYLEEELTKARTKPSYRSDLYQKMIAVNPNEPTEEEHERQAIDKPRYMQFRERCSSSWSLGFRIEGIKLPNEDPRSDFKTMQHEPEVARELRVFLQGNRELWKNFLTRLKDIREHCRRSDFFYSHEIIGSSLLFVAQHSTNTCGVWIIDFGKTSELPGDQRLNHEIPWVEGNREDGYLWGLNNLIDIWSRLKPDDDDTAASTHSAAEAAAVASSGTATSACGGDTGQYSQSGAR